jgi:hypothetical protein
MKNNIQIYNNSIEIGTRALLILSYLEKHSFDIQQLVFLDHVLIYSKDFKGPLNIHPIVPNHIAEMTYKMELFPSALKLFMSKNLIKMDITEKGFFYSATKNSHSFTSCLKSEYYKKMWINLEWIENNLDSLENTRLYFFKNKGMKN